LSFFLSFSYHRQMTHSIATYAIWSHNEWSICPTSLHHWVLTTSHWRFVSVLIISSLVLCVGFIRKSNSQNCQLNRSSSCRGIDQYLELWYVFCLTCLHLWCNVIAISIRTRKSNQILTCLKTRSNRMFNNDKNVGVRIVLEHLTKPVINFFYNRTSIIFVHFGATRNSSYRKPACNVNKVY